MSDKIIMGLVHLLPMPNTPFYEEGNLDLSIEKALKDVRALKEGGAKGCLIQTVDKVYPNTDDTDYVRVSGLSVIADRVRQEVGEDFIIGVQLMWNSITPSLAVAKAAKADFVRCTSLGGDIDSMYGRITPNPLEILNYRKAIDGLNIKLLAEISGYHTRTDSMDIEKIVEIAGQNLTIGADALEIHHSDEEMTRKITATLKENYPDVPVILGGGTNIENASRRLEFADGALVGSAFQNGDWGGNVVAETVRKYMDSLD